MNCPLCDDAAVEVVGTIRLSPHTVQHRKKCVRCGELFVIRETVVPETDSVIIPSSQLTREQRAYHSLRLRELSKSIKGTQRKLEQAKFNEAWEKVEREDLIREQLRKDRLGIDPLAPSVRKRRERELAAIPNWFTPPMKRKAVEGQRAIFRAALRVRTQDPHISLDRLVDHPEVMAVRKLYGPTKRGLAKSTVLEYLRKMWFGTNRRGRPKKNQ